MPFFRATEDLHLNGSPETVIQEGTVIDVNFTTDLHVELSWSDPRDRRRLPIVSLPFFYENWAHRLVSFQPDWPTHAEQINRLAAFILENVPGEPSEDQGAVDTAIRLIQSMLDGPEPPAPEPAREEYPTVWERLDDG